MSYEILSDKPEQQKIVYKDNDGSGSVQAWVVWFQNALNQRRQLAFDGQRYFYQKTTRSKFEPVSEGWFPKHIPAYFQGFLQKQALEQAKELKEAHAEASANTKASSLLDDIRIAAAEVAHRAELIDDDEADAKTVDPDHLALLESLAGSLRDAIDDIGNYRKSIGLKEKP